MSNTQEQKTKKCIKCGDCNYYISCRCSLFGGKRYGHDGCQHGETGGLHPDVAKAYRNRI